MELTVVIAPSIIIIGTVITLVSKSLINMYFKVVKLEDAIEDLQQQIPVKFAAEWEVHRDKMERVLRVIDANSSLEFIHKSNPVPEQISRLFEKKLEQGIKKLTDYEIEQMIIAMNVIINNPDAVSEEKYKAELQVAYLEGVKAERATWNRSQKAFPAIKQPERARWWKVFLS